MKRLSAAFGLILALAACSSDPAPRLSDRQVLAPKIALDVKVISLADRSGMQPQNSVYNTNRFSPTIAEAVKGWATDRLQATGQSGQAIILIKKATVTSDALPIKTGMSTWFKRQQALKYTGEVAVSIEATGRTGFAATEANAIRTVTLPEDPSSDEKQDAYIAMLDGLMKDLSANLEAGIRAHMTNFVTTSPVFGARAVPMDASAPAAPQGEPTALEPNATK